MLKAKTKAHGASAKHQKTPRKKTLKQKHTTPQHPTTTPNSLKKRHISTHTSIHPHVTTPTPLNRNTAFFTPIPPTPTTWSAFTTSTTQFTPYCAQTLPHEQFVANLRASRNTHHNATFTTKSAFRHTTPQRFIGRALIVAGLLGVGLSARYLIRGGAAFVNAYRDTAENLKPVQDEELAEASAEIADAARNVVDKADEEEREEEERQERLRVKEYEKEHPKETGAPKFYNDDVSFTFDKAAAERKKREEEEKLLNKQRFELNEEELEMNQVFEKWDQMFYSGADGFPEELTLLDAERILQCSPNPCLEELKERRAVMMRLNHPDMGGSPFLAAKVNEAFEKLQHGAKSDPGYTARRQKEKEEELERRKEVLRQFEEERLKKEGILDEEGTFVHPDGDTGKRYDGEKEQKM